MWQVERRTPEGAMWDRLMGRYQTLEEAAILIIDRQGLAAGDELDLRWRGDTEVFTRFRVGEIVIHKTVKTVEVVKTFGTPGEDDGTTECPRP